MGDFGHEALCPGEVMRCATQWGDVQKGLRPREAQFYVETTPPVIWTGKTRFGRVEIWVNR